MARLLLIALVVSTCLAMPLFAGSALAFEEEAILLQFNPEEDFSSRYMFQMIMVGSHVSPGVMNRMGFGDFLIGTVYKDTVVESLYGLNKHRVSFYNYHVMESEIFGSDTVDNRFGGTPWPALPGGGSGDPGGPGR